MTAYRNYAVWHWQIKNLQGQAAKKLLKTESTARHVGDWHDVDT